MPSTLSEKIRALFTAEDVRATFAQTILGLVLTGGFNLLLLVFAWSYDNYWLTLLATALCVAILGATGWLLLRHIGAVLRLEKSEKQKKAATQWRYRWERLKTRTAARWEKFLTHWRPVTAAIFGLLVVAALTGVVAINLANYLRVRAALEQQDDGARPAKRSVQGRYLIVLDQFEERGSLSDDIAFPQRLREALEDAKEDYALPLEFRNRSEAPDLDSLARVCTSIYLVGGWYDARDVRITVKQVVDSTRRVDYLAAKWGIYDPEIIRQMKLDTLSREGKSPHVFSDPLVGEYLLRIGVQKDVQYFVARMMGDLFFDEFQLTQRIRALTPEAARFLPALYDANYLYSISENNITREVSPLTLFPQPNKHLSVYRLYDNQCRAHMQVASILVDSWSKRSALDRTVKIPEDSILTIERFAEIAGDYREKYLDQLPDYFADNDSIRLYNGITNIGISKAKTMAGLFRINNQSNDLNAQAQRELQLATAAGNSTRKIDYLLEIKSSAEDRRKQVIAMKNELKRIQASDKRDVAELEGLLDRFSAKYTDQTSKSVALIVRLFLVGDSLIQTTTDKTIAGFDTMEAQCGELIRMVESKLPR